MVEVSHKNQGEEDDVNTFIDESPNLDDADQFHFNVCGLRTIRLRVPGVVTYHGMNAIHIYELGGMKRLRAPWSETMFISQPKRPLTSWMKKPIVMRCMTMIARWKQTTASRSMSPRIISSNRYHRNKSCLEIGESPS